MLSALANSRFGSHRDNLSLCLLEVAQPPRRLPTNVVFKEHRGPDSMFVPGKHGSLHGVCCVGPSAQQAGQPAQVRIGHVIKQALLHQVVCCCSGCFAESTVVCDLLNRTTLCLSPARYQWLSGLADLNLYVMADNGADVFINGVRVLADAAANHNPVSGPS